MSTVFTSRWKALWWSAGILMTAYCTVPSAEQTKQDAAEQAEMAKVAKQVENLNLNLGKLNNKD